MFSRNILLEEISNPIQIIYTTSFTERYTENPDYDVEYSTTSFNEEENNEDIQEDEENSAENLILLSFIDLEILKKDSWAGFFCRMITYYCNKTLDLSLDDSIFGLFF